jgi:hypothetical protein
MEITVPRLTPEAQEQIVREVHNCRERSDPQKRRFVRPKAKLHLGFLT